MYRITPRFLFLTLLVASVGCEAPHLPSRPPAQSGATFGEKLFTIACQRVAYNSSLEANRLDPRRPVDVSGSRYRLACRYGGDYLPLDYAKQHDPKLAAFFSYRKPFIDSVNQIFPTNELSELQSYMLSILSLTDDGSFPRLVGKTADAIDLTQQSADVNVALSRMESRLGYRPSSIGLGILREALTYPRLSEALDATFAVVAEGGAARAPFMAMVEGLSFELRSMKRVDDPSSSNPLHPGSANRMVRVALDLLFTTHPQFATNSARWLVERDYRGLAKVRKVGTTVVGPFIDQDGDGLADVDTLGYFVTQSNVVAPAPFHYDPTVPDSAVTRDGTGRAFAADGKTVYRYIDLDKTLLAALSREAIKLLDPVHETALKLCIGAAALLGERKQTQRFAPDGSGITFAGFDAARSPLLDLLYGALSVLKAPNMLRVLDGAKVLLTRYEHEIAIGVQALITAKDIFDTFPAKKIAKKSTVMDELIQLMRRAANTPGLLEDLIKALGDPRIKNLDRMFANYFSYRDVHRLSGDRVVGEGGGASFFARKVDRSQPDSGFNRSIQHRLLHMVHDANGMVLCNKPNAKIDIPVICDIPWVDSAFGCQKVYRECEIFEVKNGALFYLQSMVKKRDSQGRLTNTVKAHLRLKTENMPSAVAAAIDTLGADFLLETITGIDGMTEHPSPQAINRFLFMDKLPMLMKSMADLPKDKDGEYTHRVHQGTLYSWEIRHPNMSCTYNDPCVFFDAFAPIAQAFADHDAELILLDMISVMHRHWSSTRSSDYQYQDPSGANFSHGSNMVSYEPALAAALLQGGLVSKLSQMSVALENARLSDGKKLAPELEKLMRYVLDPTQSPSLRYRDGRARAVYNDGVTVVPGGVAPINLIADAFSAASDARDAAAPDVSADWKAGVDHFVDVFFGTEQAGGKRRFVNRRLVPMATVLVDFLKKRIVAHEPNCSVNADCLAPGRCDTTTNRCTTRHRFGDLDNWLSFELPHKLEDLLTSPVVAGAVDFLRGLRKDARANKELNALLRYLVDEAQNSATFAATLTGIADLLQVLLDDADLVPLAHVLGKALEPKFGLVDTAIRFLGPAFARDKNKVLSRILGNAVKEQPNGDSPLEVMLEIAKGMHRKQPGTTGPYTAQDYGSALSQLSDLMGNQQTGLVKFFELIVNRCGGPC
jgi:hypothetical protein